MRQRFFTAPAAAILLAGLSTFAFAAHAQAVTLSVRTNTQNDTLYVGLPGAVLFSLDATDTCVTIVNWWSEWKFTKYLALGDMRPAAHLVWSDSALAYFDSTTSNRFIDLAPPETTYVVAQDRNDEPWRGSGELYRVALTPMDTTTLSFNFQFTSGPPTWQTMVTPCGGAPMIPDYATTTIHVVDCSAGGLLGGDVNFDRQVDSADVTYLAAWLAGTGPAPVIANLGDVNCDFAVDSADLALLDDYVAHGGAPPCDPCLTVAQNDLPETYLIFDTLEIFQPNYNSVRVVRPRIYYSLPVPTATYPGIVIRWKASDSLDHPLEQPPFDFNWVLFGPYADQAPALPDSSLLLVTNDDPGTPALEWAPDTSHAFCDLRDGWYVFWIRSRDDSLGIDPTPSVARFRVLEPTFEKPFLLMDASNWYNGYLLNCGSYDFRNQRQDSLTPSMIQEWYKDLFEGNGYAFDREVDTWARQIDFDTNWCADCYRIFPDRDVLSSYKALIVYDEDMLMPLDRDNFQQEYGRMLDDYVAVGGRLALIGRNLFGPWDSLWLPNGPPNTKHFHAADFAARFFGLSSLNFQGDTYIAMNAIADSADFAGATPINPSFPALAVDTTTTLLLSQLPIPGIRDRTGDLWGDWLWLPDVNVVDVDPAGGAVGLYSFQATDPASSPNQGRFCGVQYEYFDTVLSAYTFKTVLLTFPLSTLKRDGSPEALAGALLDYILGGFPTDVASDDDGTRPVATELLPNYPNPFNASTMIRFETATTQHVALHVYNLLGRRIATPVDGVLPAGRHEVAWNGVDYRGRPVASGVYFYAITTDGVTHSRKMLLLK